MEWASLGGTWIIAPHVVAAGPDRLALLVVGTDHVVRARWRIDGEWGGWTALPGTVITVPTVVDGPNGRLDLLAVDPKHSILHSEWTGVEWTGWRSLTGEAGGPLIDMPRALLPGGPAG